MRLLSGSPRLVVGQGGGLQLHLRLLLPCGSCRLLLLLGLQRLLLKPHRLHVPHLHCWVRRPLPARQHWRRRRCRLWLPGRGWTVHSIGCQDHVDDSGLRAKARLRGWDPRVEAPEPELAPGKEPEPLALVEALKRPLSAWLPEE